VTFWDTRHLLRSGGRGPEIVQAAGPVSEEMRLLATAAAELHRCGVHAPLSLVRDLLELLGGRPVASAVGELASEAGVRRLVELHWPPAARIGLAALLLHDLPLADWEAPAELTPTELREGLLAALAGEVIEPHTPAVPLAGLRDTARRIDERLLALLQLVGAEAMATEPGLGLRLLTRLGPLAPLTAVQRQLLGVRVQTTGGQGRASGRGAGIDGAQVAGVELGRLRTDWGALLPSQLALPPHVLAYRYQRGEVLFRSREVAEPPRLRPTILVLDVSPPTFGPVERITRLAAFLAGATLHRAGQPVVLIVPAARGELVLSLARPADLLEVWTQRTLAAADPARLLRLAGAMQATLSAGSVTAAAIVLLLTQPWFGAEQLVARPTGLRAIFVQYPGQSARPALAPACEQWHSLTETQAHTLPTLLGSLLS
jgi:ATP-dependent Clp protease ATP-binding subunit ClpC